jgi:hypothetical protein
MGVTAKRAVVVAGHEYIRAAYGHDTWERILAHLPPHERELLHPHEAPLDFPVEVDGRVFEALVNVHFGGSRMLAEADLRAGGAVQADVMLDGGFAVFDRFESPQQAFARSGSLIASVYDGVVAQTEHSADGRGGTIRILGLEDSPYIAPWQCGWIERALSRFGAPAPCVTERSWEAGLVTAPELVYDVTWA